VSEDAICRIVGLICWVDPKKALLVERRFPWPKYVCDADIISPPIPLKFCFLLNGLTNAVWKRIPLAQVANATDVNTVRMTHDVRNEDSLQVLRLILPLCDLTSGEISKSGLTEDMLQLTHDVKSPLSVRPLLILMLMI
jgi:hypothetical protein